MAIIDQQPRDTTVNEGQNATFYIVATSEAPESSPVYYQWQEFVAGQWEDIDDSKNSSATSDTLIISNVTYNGNNGSRYQCGVWDTESSTTYSDEARLYVNEPVVQPLSITDPENRSVSEGQDAVFSVQASGGETPYTYTWWEVSADPVTYPAEIEDDPSDASVIEGQSATFSVAVKGTTPINFEWQEWMDQDIWETVPAFKASGIYGRVLTIDMTTISEDDGRQFRCMVYNDYGSPDYSSPAYLYVNEPGPPDLLPPVNFSGQATGITEVKLRWQSSNTQETHYEIRRDQSSLGSFALDDSQLVMEGDYYTYIDTYFLEEGTTYSYTIVSRRQTDYSVSDEAGPISVKTLTSQPDVLNPPTDFSGEHVQTASGIRLMWNEPTSGEPPTGYLIERKLSTSNTWTSIITVQAGTTLYWDYNILENTTYNYRIRSTHLDIQITPSGWEITNVTTGETPDEAITNFTKIANGILQIKADPYDDDPTPGTSPRWETVPYETNYRTGTSVYIEFPKVVGDEEFLEITDGSGRAWFPDDPAVSYDPSTDNYTVSITIPEVDNYNLNFAYRATDIEYALVLRSEEPDTGVKLQVSTDGEVYTFYFTNNLDPPTLSYPEFTFANVVAPKTIGSNTEFSHWLLNGETIYPSGETPTIELYMVRDRDLTAVYTDIVTLGAPQVSVINGYERIYVDISQPTGGEIPDSYKIYKKLVENVDPNDPAYLGPPIPVQDDAVDEEGNSIYDNTSAFYPNIPITLTPTEYTVPILNEHGYFFFEEVQNTGTEIRFIDENVPLGYERRYIVSSNIGENEVFAQTKNGFSDISGLGIRWETQPESTTVDIGTDVIFNAVAIGVDSISYQWYLNGLEISGAVGTSLTLLNVTSGMDNQKYYCIATDNDSGERIKTIEAILRIRIIDGPTGLSATIADNNVLLSWVDNSNNEDGFILYHSTDGSNFTVLETLGANTIEYVDADLDYDTRKWYRVSAYIGTEQSEYSNTETVYVQDPRSTAPYALTAIGNVSSINLNWVDDSANENGFNIWYSENDIDYVLAANVPADSTSFTHKNLLPETTYFYKVTSYNNFGESGFSNTASATTLPTPIALPKPPDNFVRRPIGLNAVPIDGGIVLNWVDDSINETGFQIYRSTNGIEFNELADIGAEVTSYFDQEEKGGIKYWYKVRAYNQINVSAFSNTAVAMTQKVIPGGGQLTTPYDLAGASFVNKNVLYWKNSNLEVDGYNIYADTNADDLFERIDTVGGSVLQYTHDSLSSGITVSYRVTSFIGNRESSPSNTISLTTKERRDEPRILVPDNLKVIAGVKSLKLIWADTSYEEEGFEIWVSDNGTDFEFLTSLPANTTEFEHSIGMPGVTRYYKVRAYSREIYSDFSEVASGTTREPQSPPKAPTNLITFTGKRNINLFWQVNGKNEQGFYVYRATGGSDKFLKIATIYSLGINKIDKYTDYNLTEGDRWCYKVSAFNSLGESEYTNISCTMVETKTKKPDGTDLDFDIEEFEGGFNVVDIGSKSSADWGFFTRRLSEYFDSKQSKSENDTASYIAKLYDETIRQGSEQYGNRILSSNPKILENFISLALNEVKAGVPNQVISQKLSQGVISYWGSVVLQANIPPPGSTMALYNSIVSPGIPNNVPVFNTTNSSDMANSLTTFFNVHTKTVAGVLTSLVSTPTGPVPTPFPWAGFA